MFVRNDTTCPNCGSVTSGTIIWFKDKARIYSKVVPVSAECGNCGHERTVLFKFEDLYETILKGYFQSFEGGAMSANECWALLKRYRHRHQVVLLNRLARGLSLDSREGWNRSDSSRYENLWFSSIAEEIWRCVSGANPIFVADSLRLRGLSL